MRVIATAGHVDHGKSTLVRRLTGMEPDRWAEERRRGLTIDLGFAWTRIGGEEIAFVDVPGHERFVPNMLAGAGPAPAVLFVVAADEGWMPQSAEHLAALDAFGVARGLLVVTKADRADPASAQAAALRELKATSLGDVPSVAVGLEDELEPLRAGIGDLAGTLPPPDVEADVRLWIDRAFTVPGAGTVVTGTLAAGTITVGDELTLGPARVKVRGLHALGQARERVGAVARVAVNLRGTGRDEVRRGDVLLTPDAWLDHGRNRRPAAPNRGTASLADPAPGDRRRAGARPSIGDGHGAADPELRRCLCASATGGCCAIPASIGSRRGSTCSTSARLRCLAEARPDVAARSSTSVWITYAATVLSRRGELRAMGLPETGDRLGEWLVDPSRFAQLRAEAPGVVAEWSRAHAVAAGMPVETLRQRLGLPALDLVAPLLAGTGLEVAGGLVRHPGAGLAPEVEKAVRVLEERLAEHPFRAPEADELRELGLGKRELAAAVRLGTADRDRRGRVARPGRRTTGPPPSSGPSTSRSRFREARRTLDSTRRVMIPLLERLDAAGLTEPQGDGTRRTT